MPKQNLDRKDIDELLSKVELCHFGTVNSEGNPYIVPLGYRYVDEAIYIHVADKGEKIDNIRRNPNICLEVTFLDPTSSMLRSEPWGDFASVIIEGKVEKVIHQSEKAKVYGDAAWARAGAVYKLKPKKITGRSWLRKK